MNDEENIQQGGAPTLAEDLTHLILETVEKILDGREREADEDYAALMDRVQDLFLRKSDLKALKSETLSLLEELFRSRFRRGFKAVVRRDGADPSNLVSYLMGTVFTASALGELALSLDRILLEQSAPQEFNFAGKGDFIAVEEVMQLLTAGHHTGVFVVEKPDNCVEMYFKEGHVAFVSPHKLTRRVIRGEGLKEYREIPVEMAREAEERFVEEGLPIFLHFLEKGFFEEDEFLSFLRDQGGELIYEFIRESSECSYRWISMQDLPEFAERFDIRLDVMPILLEAHKQMDDWRLIKRIIPDMDTPIEPAPDRFSVLAEMALDASQIKLLAMINGENTVRTMAEDGGIPPFEVASMLAEFAKLGIIVPPGGPESLLDQPQSVQESVEWALAALDANEDLDALSNSLDQVFDKISPGEGGEQGETGEDPQFTLKFMRAARKKKTRGRSRRR